MTQRSHVDILGKYIFISWQSRRDWMSVARSHLWSNPFRDCMFFWSDAAESDWGLSWVFSLSIKEHHHVRGFRAVVGVPKNLQDKFYNKVNKSGKFFGHQQQNSCRTKRSFSLNIIFQYNSLQAAATDKQICFLLKIFLHTGHFLWSKKKFLIILIIFAIQWSF